MREKLRSQRDTDCQNRETHGETVRLDRYGKCKQCIANCAATREFYW